MISMVAGVRISDVATGFRAFSREAALSINVLSHCTYTQETIIQAAAKSPQDGGGADPFPRARHGYER
jgi:hypothetical protein